MADLTKSLLDAISIIANKTAEEVSSDKTIKAIVKKNISTSEGKYLVEYNGGNFYAYIQSGSKDLYKSGEQIYVLVPEGDMGQKKFIIGKVEDNQEYQPKNPHVSILNDYVAIGGNAIIENEYKENNSVHVQRMQPLRLNSNKVNDFYYCYLHNEDIIDNSQLKYDSIQYPTLDIDEETFSNSAKQAEALLLRAKFKTSIDTENIGNYGIVVNVAFADDTNPQIADDGTVSYPPKMIAYFLDTGKMTGNPMKFYDYTSQYMIAPFDGSNYLYIDSIVAFSEGFVDQNITTENHYIYIDDIEVIGLKQVTATNGDYKLRLLTPRGNTIRVGEKTTLKITASTTYLNQDITDNTLFYWGVKDPSITSLSNNYNAKLGSGYRYLENEKKNELFLTRSDLTAAENVFICVAVYESDIILKTSLSMYNNNNKLNITIESDQGTKFQSNEGNPVLTCLINGKSSNYQEGYPDDSFSFIWSKEDLELGTILLNETVEQLKASEEKELEEYRENGISDAGRTYLEIIQYYTRRISQIGDIEYLDGVRGPRLRCKTKNINTYAVYSCSIYRAGVYIGYASITLENSKEIVNTNYYITIKNGTQVFQYDERGIAPNSEKQNNPIEIRDLIAVFHSPQGAEVTPKRVRWIVPQNDTLIQIPSLGLQTDIETDDRYYLGDLFPLRIKENYDGNCINNQLIVVVTHEDGTEYRQETNLLFTKIGDIGTNGTGVVVKINELGDVPSEERLTLIKETNNQFYNNGRSQEYPILNTELYINNNQVLGHTTKWSIAGDSGTQSYHYQIIDNDGNNDCIVKYNEDSTKIDTRIIKAQTSFGGKYCSSFYGIPTIEYLNDYSYDNYKIRIMRDGTLNSVLYDSNGTNPSYNLNQGVHVELDGWDNPGYLEWEVESGPKQKNMYREPNILLSTHPRTKTGSRRLAIVGDTLELVSAVENFKISDNKSSIEYYINDFLIDVKEIGLDTILSISEKIEKLIDRTNAFWTFAPNNNNAKITQIYTVYSNLFNKIQEEYNNCKKINKENTKLYDKIQDIWNSEWPSVITQDKTHLLLGDINTIQKLVDVYKLAYDNRSNDISDDATISNKLKTVIEYIKDGTFRVDSENNPRGFDGYFISLLRQLDESYSSYISDKDISSFHSILVEYTKILIGYLNILMIETRDCFNDNQTDIWDFYSSIYEEWDSENDPIGKDIYEILIASNGNIANVYDYIRGLYEYYQRLFKSVQKYQIAEDSETLKIWNASLNGEELNILKQIYVIPNDTFNGIYMNNNVVGTVFVKENDDKVEIAKIYVPIIMTLNTYELAALNGWDGTSVEVGEDHITTPQIGAGIKDEKTNTFTGMIMGAINNISMDGNSKIPKFKKVNKVGLVGYSDGKQSVFIDSKTGRAYFGLPDDDIESTSGTNEGRIELIPGGVSKIGNWKIGNRFLYNIVNGSYEKRADGDIRGEVSKQKIMIPHDKHGIILSSDQPYIHIKGKIYENDDLSNIDYTDEYNEISPEDSLELRLDPNNNSLFSIVQHTAGFGDEENENLFTGYATEDSTKTIITIAGYTPNKNILANGDDRSLEYYIYGLVYDVNGKPKPYYIQQIDSGLEKEYTAWNDSDVTLDYPWYKTSFELYHDTDLLKNAIDEDKVKRAFSINSDTGVISYNANLLVWKNNTQGISNKNNWYSNITSFSSDLPFEVGFNYNKVVETPIESDIKIGKFKNNTTYLIYKINFKYNINYDSIRIELNNNNYIQFYVTENEEDDIEDAILKSDFINFYNNEHNNNIMAELFSYGDSYLEPNSDKIYCLKAKIYIPKYTINSSYFYRVKSLFTNYQTPPDSDYGILEISNLNDGTVNFTTSNGRINNISGSYEIYIDDNNERQIKFKVNGTMKYDFIIWRKNESEIFGGGQTFQGDYAKFFTNQFEIIDNLLDHYTLINPPSLENHWCISFYPEGFFTDEEISYENNDISTSTDNQDIVQTDTVTIIKYKLNDNIPMETKNKYEINWLSSSDYNNAGITWGFELSGLDIGNIISLIPENTDYLCIQGDAKTTGIQGIPYSKTYWKDNIQRVKFYKWYYELVNKDSTEKSSYGYIDIDVDKSLYYKHIKTLMQRKVDAWFTANVIDDVNPFPDIEYSGKKDGNVWSWIDIPTPVRIFENAIYWKEFIRVGLDENGRLFSAGIQDKRTYSRTGRLTAFGEVPHLYGQEIRTRPSSSYIPIVKIFSQINNLKFDTAYITQGATETGNISIRTADKGYVELAASESSNESGNIPEKTTFVQVQHQDIKIQSKDSINGSISFIHLNHQKNNSMITMKADVISILSSNEITKHEINDSYNRIITPEYTISSINNFSSSLNDNDNYRIKAISGYDGNGINLSKIKLELGKNTNIELLPFAIEIETNKNNYIKINDDTITNFDFTEDIAKFAVSNMKVYFRKNKNNDIEENIIGLQNKNLDIRLITTKNQNSSSSSILLSSNINDKNNYSGQIEISKEVSIKGKYGFIVENGPSNFKNRVSIESSAYIKNNLSVGYDFENNQSNNGMIYLYKDNNQWTCLSAKNLEQMFEWYNKYRWAVGWNGNTVWLKSVGGNNYQEGSYKWNPNRGKYDYVWAWKTFSDKYKGEGRR